MDDKNKNNPNPNDEKKDYCKYYASNDRETNLWEKTKDNLNKVIIPLCLPLTLLYFSSRQNEIADSKKNADKRAANEKERVDKEIAKINNRLETEIQVLNVIWPDLTSQDTIKIKNALDVSNSFLRKIYHDGIDSLSPLLTSVSVIAEHLAASNKNNSVRIKAATFNISNSMAKTTQSITPYEASTQEKTYKYEVANLKPVIEQVQAIQQNLKNTNMKPLSSVFIQFSSLQNKAVVEQLASKLSDYYVVPPIEYVSNTVGYGKEIRYFHENDSSVARTIQKSIFESTGKTFQVKNIRYNGNVSNNIEIWYDNTVLPPKSDIQTISVGYNKVANFENLWFKQKYTLNFKEYNLSILLVAIDKAAQNVRVSLSAFDSSFDDKELTLSKQKGQEEFTIGKYKYILKLNDIGKAGRNPFNPAAFIDLVVLTKK